MRTLLTACLLTVAATSAHAVDVGASITIGDPNFFGRIDIGDFPRPDVIFAQPVTAIPVVGVPPPGPMYLRIPPGHEKHWDKHCAKYNACGAPVYFVRDNWYQDVYAPEYRSKHPGKGGGNGQGKGNKGNKGHGHGQNR